MKILLSSDSLSRLSSAGKEMVRNRTQLWLTYLAQRFHLSKLLPLLGWWELQQQASVELKLEKIDYFLFSLSILSMWDVMASGNTQMLSILTLHSLT